MKTYKTSILVFKDEEGVTILRRKNLEEVCCKFYIKFFKIQEKFFEQFKLKA
jgi:hypothetical protein